jgi:hypothetical protein
MLTLRRINIAQPIHSIQLTATLPEKGFIGSYQVWLGKEATREEIVIYICFLLIHKIFIYDGGGVALRRLTHMSCWRSASL